jgi:hypothetical protein
MQTSAFRFVALTTIALGALVDCSGSDFQSSGKSLKTDDGGPLGGSTSTGGSTATGGRGNGGKANGGTTSTGGSVSGGTGGTSGAPGSGGSVVGGSPGDSGMGNTTGSGGVIGAGGAGAGGGVVGCTSPTTFYPDADKDTFGRSTGTVIGCAPPAIGNWSTVGGDCDDDDENVHPKQTTYFDNPHSTSGGIHSFDYDCSGAEEGDPSQVGAAPVCSTLSLGCTGTGYVKTSRTGPGVNALCGSTVQSTCKVNVLACNAVLVTVSAYRCK